MAAIALDILKDLIGDNRSPSAFAVYFYLWSKTRGVRSARISHQTIADDTGLSKSTVQGAIRLLNRRKLIRSVHSSRTAVPEHFVVSR
jgi:DNA-binding MarR family transcriptional regulator